MSINIVGQEKLLEKLNRYTLTTLPKTLLFLGEYGCGKHSIVKYLTNKLNLDLVKLDTSITAEQLIDFSQRTVPTAYLIVLSDFSEKQQNQFLKFIEEPSESAFIMLIADSEIGILPTILNRCIKIYFEPYTIEQLKEVTKNRTINNELIYEICKTPGQLLDADTSNFTALYSLCEKFVTRVSEAAYPNTISIVTKINCKENYDKFDFNTFFNVLEYISLKYFKETNNKNSFKIYTIINKFKQARINKPIIKENFLINFLTQVWKETHK